MFSLMPQPYKDVSPGLITFALLCFKYLTIFCFLYIGMFTSVKYTFEVLKEKGAQFTAGFFFLICKEIYIKKAKYLYKCDYF